MFGRSHERRLPDHKRFRTVLWSWNGVPRRERYSREAREKRQETRWNIMMCLREWSKERQAVSSFTCNGCMRAQRSRSSISRAMKHGRNPSGSWMDPHRNLYRMKSGWVLRDLRNSVLMPCSGILSITLRISSCSFHYEILPVSPPLSAL